MNTHCEIVGWVLDSDQPRVLLRENGQVVAAAESTFADRAIQTGAFLRGAPIVDPITRQTVGYEMKSLTEVVLEAV
jgi:hypothetical protein